MDRKIRIYFFPRDASRIRAIVLSRPLGLAFLFVALPLCVLGYWIGFSGKLRESPERHFERTKLERETAALNEKTAALQSGISGLRKNLDSLESVRISVTLSSGLEPGKVEEERTVSDRARHLFGFVSRSHRTEEFTRALAEARGISQFMDSSLFVLARDADLVERLPTVRPVAAHGIVTRPFGTARDPFTGRKSLHSGVDFSLPPGSPVLAVGGGTVTGSGLDPVWGYYVRIRHTDRVETFYAHLQKTNVKTGRGVGRGQVIGWIGQSGVSTGPHLHFEMRLWGEHVDPMAYLLSGSRNL